MIPLLLDTCAVIWSSDDAGLSTKAADAIETHSAAGGIIYVSPISAWEIGMLAGKGRLSITENPKKWLDRLLVKPNLRLAEMSMDVMLSCGTLPEPLHGDPADRIIIATAREYGLRIVTRDQKILDYAEKGHVMALAC
jgi:PIN domain nuclease of toxin-antitoxin system